MELEHSFPLIIDLHSLTERLTRKTPILSTNRGNDYLDIAYNYNDIAYFLKKITWTASNAEMLQVDNSFRKLGFRLIVTLLSFGLK